MLNGLLMTAVFCFTLLLESVCEASLFMTTSYHLLHVITFEPYGTVKVIQSVILTSFLFLSLISSPSLSLLPVFPSLPLLPLSDLFEALSELIILTASACLHGKEIRSMLDEKVAQLYADLDGGFSHAAWLLPGWLPLPSFR